jgi:cytochrome b561
MSLMNTNESYGAIAKLFHWVIGLTLLFNLGLGLYMHELPNTPDKFQLYALHKSLGITILILVVLRVIWTLVNPKPRMLIENMKGWEVFLAKGVHYILYALMIFVPITGWLMNSASGFPTPLFKIMTVPNLIAPNKSLQDLFGQVHEVLAMAFIAIFVLHLAGALKHHFLVKDRTLVRMLPFTKK